MRRLSWLFGLLLITACGGSSEEGSQTTQGDTGEAAQQIEQTAETVPVELATRRVACGCAIEDVGSCGNYIEIDGDYVVIANSVELGLGAMEWCGKEGVTAESSGELKDGRFFAATLVAGSEE